MTLNVNSICTMFSFYNIHSVLFPYWIISEKYVKYELSINTTQLCNMYWQAKKGCIHSGTLKHLIIRKEKKERKHRLECKPWEDKNICSFSQNTGQPLSKEIKEYKRKENSWYSFKEKKREKKVTI